MISFSHADFFNVVLVGPFLLIVLLLCLVAVKKVFGKIVKLIETNISFKKRMKEVEAMKARGEHHEWVLMAVTLTKNAHVCKKTGWCPDMYGFYDVKYVQGIAKAQAMAEEYGKYRNRRLADIALEYNIDFDEFMVMIDKIIAIQKDYHVMKLDNLQKELKQK